MTIMMKRAASCLSLCLLVPSARQAFFVAPPLLQAKAPIRATAAVAAAASATVRATMRVCGIESTPNPSSFKFDLDQSLGHRSGAAGATKGFTYSSVGAAGDQQAPEPILRVLELQGVESVYALGDWLCVNKKPSAKWDAIVPAAVEALGGPAESLDPLTLLMASGGDGGSAWQRSEMDGIAIRLQVSNGIPIQLEACPPGGTPLRRKLSSRFVDAMTEFVSGSGDEMAFFKGRQWIPRGVRYPSEEGEGETGGEEAEGAAAETGKEVTAAERMATAAEEALSAAAEEVELAYHESRLRGAVNAALNNLRSTAEAAERSSDAAAVAAAAAAANDATASPSQAPSSGEGEQKAAAAAAAAAAEAKSAIREAVATLQQVPPPAEKGQVVGAVDTLCALAEKNDASAAKDALDALIGFAASGDGPVAARRAAVAFIGGAGDAVGGAGLDAVAAVFRGDKSPGVRRTAGDALSDLGNPAAVPIATAGLCDKSKLVRWRAARVVGELASREQDAVSLDEAREGEGEFEVAFEMSDAARKVRARVAAAAEGGEEGVAVAGVGPVWKQIQERGL